MLLQQNQPEPSLLDQARLLTYKTPFFFTRKDILQQNYEKFLTLFDNAEVCYALKANSDPRILSYLNELEAGFEAASAFEVFQLIDVGVPPHRIIYGTSIKPAGHISMAFHAGVSRFAADSKEEVKKIAQNAPGAKVYIRAIVDDKDSVFTMSERFGTPVNTVEDMLLYVKSLGLHPYGISFYVGSQAAHANMWSKGIHKIRPVIESLYHQDVRLDVVNIGGGFPVHYDNHLDAPELRQIVAETNDALHTLPYIPKLILEPGRGIVATSTVLVSEIIARNDRADKPWLCMDAGIYNALYEAMIHQGSTLYPVQLANPPLEPVERLPFTLAGPTGDSLDIIYRDLMLPSFVGVGDRLIFEHAGAYTVTMASRFNGFPAPPLFIH